MVCSALFGQPPLGSAQPEIGDLAALTRHSQSMERLIRENPALALDTALPDSTLEALRARFPSSSSLIETRGEWEGPLTVVVQDALDRRQSRTARWIRADGKRVELHGPGAPETSCSGTVRIRGVRLGDHIAVESAREGTAGSPCTVTGQQNVAVLLVNFKTAHLPSWFTTSLANSAFFEPGASMDSFWRENSFGATMAAGQVFGPFNLDADYDCYEVEALLDAAIQAADSGVDLRRYQRVFIVAPGGDCWWAGMSTVGCVPLASPANGDFTASVSWILIPPDGTRELVAGLVSHESGHGFGLNHSRSLDYDTVPLAPPGVVGVRSEYGDVYSNMGTGSFQWPAPQKSALGWFSSQGNVQQVTAAGAFTLAPYETATTAVQALRIQRGAGSNQWLWVEYRQPIGTFDSAPGNSMAFDAALIHFEDGSTPGSTFTDLLDFQPVRRPNDFAHAPLKTGQTWRDPSSPLTLAIGAAGPDRLQVAVAYEDPCATLLPARTTYGPLAQTGTIAISGPASCSWTAVSTARWIAITSGQSGSGDGTVAFALDANTNGVPRTGVIYAGRQRWAITQQPSWPNLVLSIDHSGPFTAGGTGAFNVTVTNTGNAATTTEVGIRNAPGSGLVAIDLSGPGWSCSALDLTCWRSDPLAPRQSYPPVTIGVSVAPDGTADSRNQASALLKDPSGAVFVMATVSDLASTVSAFPDLTIALSHAGNFVRDTSAMLTAVAANTGNAPTSGPVTVTVKLPSPALTVASVSGLGWSCVLETLACTRDAAVPAGASFPPILIRASVAADAPSTLTTSASVSGGGEVNTNNDQASDVIEVVSNCRERRPFPRTADPACRALPPPY